METPTVAQLVGPRALVGVVDVDEPAVAAELTRCLGDAGLSAVEITLRSPGALAALEAAALVEGVTVGAGTVYTADQLRSCHAAGAQFAVSPVFDESVASVSRAVDLPFVPGAATPTEVHRVLDAGFTEVKVFPASPLGGFDLVKSLAAIFPGASFMPTGGIDEDAAIRYLDHRAVFAVGGSWMASADLVRDRDWATVGERARSAVRTLGVGQ